MVSSIKISENSRYVATPPYQLRNSIGALTNYYTYGVWRRVKIPKTAYDTVHRVAEHELGRLDLISYNYYNNPRLWWVIADVNGINNPFDDMVAGQEILIPDYDALKSALREAAANQSYD